MERKGWFEKEAQKIKLALFAQSEKEFVDEVNPELGIDRGLELIQSTSGLSGSCGEKIGRTDLNFGVDGESECAGRPKSAIGPNKGLSHEEMFDHSWRPPQARWLWISR